MIKFFKKHKLKIITSLFCAFALSLFTILSFGCKTYAYTIDNNGNLVGDNLFHTNDFTSNNANVHISISNNVCTYNGTSSSGHFAIIDSFNIAAGTYSYRQFFLSGTSSDNANLGTVKFGLFDSPLHNIALNSDSGSFTINSDTTFSVVVWFSDSNMTFNNLQIGFMLTLSSSIPTSWEPYGVWYSQTNYDTINRLYDNTLEQYTDLALGNNYGYFKYIDYAEFYINGTTNIFVPNTQEQNEWNINDLYNNNILKIGGYFDTTPLTIEPYQSNYDKVVTYISFKNFSPSESFIITFNNSTGCNVTIYDNDSNVFTSTITDTDNLIDINEIKEVIPSFGLYITEMRIVPNNAEQNGVYFANNDYVTAYNKGYNVATSNADRKYIPQITDLQNQINSLNNNVIELKNNINTLKSLNDDLQNQLSNNVGWQSLFFAMADTPVRTVSNVLGFELFGLNLFSTFIGMVTVFAIVWLLKKFI